MRHFQRSFPHLRQDTLVLRFRSFSTTEGPMNIAQLLRNVTAQVKSTPNTPQINYTFQPSTNYNSNFRTRASDFTFNQLDQGQLSSPDWSKMKFKITKQLYKEKSHISNLSPEEVQQIRSSFDMKSNSTSIPNPISNFSDIDWPLSISTALQKNTFATPFPIQRQIWPMALQGNDIVGIAETGSGKTLAYLLPGLVHLQAQKIKQTPVVLIVAPTRELTQQIFQEFEKFSNREFKGVCLYGGDKRENQVSKIRKNIPEVIVATPGRLIDFMSTGIVNLNRVSYLVLDEADRLLDMGFEPQIKKILIQTPSERQTLMFSATWPKEVRSLAAEFMSNFIHLTIGSDVLQANPNVTQLIVQSTDLEKQQLLIHHVKTLVEQESNVSILIFCNTKAKVEDLVSLINRNIKVSAKAFHGDKSQSYREITLEYFRKGMTKILVASDAAARGLDVKNISCVINYDFPRDIESYVHRIGRTGRAGSKGTSISYFTNANSPLKNSLIHVLKQVNQEIPDFLKRRDVFPF